MNAPPDDADAYTVMRAIKNAVALVEAGADAARVQWVGRHLDDADDWVASTAADAAGPLGLREAVPRLIRMLGYEREAQYTIDSPGMAYAAAMVDMEYVDVRLGAARSLGMLITPEDELARAALLCAAAHEGEHPSVREAARRALARVTTAVPGAGDS